MLKDATLSAITQHRGEFVTICYGVFGYGFPEVSHFSAAFLLLRKVQVAFLLVEEFKRRDFYCRINNPRSNPN